MISMILLELLSVTALLFSTLLIFLEFAPLEVMALLFAWVVAVCLFHHYSRNWAKVFRLSILLLLAPLFFYHDSIALIFFLIAVPLLLLYLERFLFKGSLADYVGNFKRMSIIYPVAFYLRWVLPDIGEAIDRAAPFIFVYFLASIMLIRSARHVEAGMDIRVLQRTNIRYLAFTAAIFLLTTVEKVRQFVISLAKQFVLLLFLPMQLLLRLIAWLTQIIDRLQINFSFKTRPLPEFSNVEDIGEPPPLETVEEMIALPGMDILKKVLCGLLIGATIFILYKLLVRGGRQTHQGLDYVEEREYLKRGGQRRKRRFWFGDRLPSQPGQQVRYYYRRFLEKLVGQQVGLTKTDTSLEIQKKAETIFPHGPQQIRDIYIASRYGEKEVDSTVVTQMEQLYKQL